MSFANDTIVGTAHGPETCQRLMPSLVRSSRYVSDSTQFGIIDNCNSCTALQQYVISTQSRSNFFSPHLQSAFRDDKVKPNNAIVST